MITLYHGSSSIVKLPIANAGRRNLDFGRGFYMTKLYDQAEKWAKIVSSRKSEDAIGIVNVYEIELENAFSECDSWILFPEYNLDWLNFVVSCRNGTDISDYQIVEGGVANDQVIDTIEDFENGRITAEQALDQLRYKKPNNQICIRDQKIIDKYLRFVKSLKTNRI